MKNVRVNNLTMRVEMTRNSLTLDTLKKVSGVSRATLSAVRNGKSCSISTAEKIAAALKISVTDLIEESEV